MSPQEPSAPDNGIHATLHINTHTHTYIYHIYILYVLYNKYTHLKAQTHTLKQTNMYT